MAPLTINQHTREIAQIQAPEDETDYILVECSQLSPVDLQQLQATGAQVLSREGNDDTFLCRYTEPVVDGLAKIEALPFVKLARVYHPSLVLHPEVVKHLAEGDKGTIELSVYLHSCKESGDDVFRLIREIDAEATLVQCGDTFVSVRMKPSRWLYFLVLFGDTRRPIRPYRCMFLSICQGFCCNVLYLTVLDSAGLSCVVLYWMVLDGRFNAVLKTVRVMGEEVSNGSFILAHLTDVTRSRNRTSNCQG